MELDIAEFRKMEAELHGFELPDFSMKFYYDEMRNAVTGEIMCAVGE